MRLVPCNKTNDLRLGPAWKAKTLQGQVQGLFSMAGYSAAIAASFKTRVIDISFPLYFMKKGASPPIMILSPIKPMNNNLIYLIF